MFGNFLNSVRDVVVNAVAERTDLSELRSHWHSVQRFFREASNTDDPQRLVALSDQLPEVVRRLDGICELLASEREEYTREFGAAAAHIDRGCFTFVFGTDTNVFVHACTLAKANQPPGSRVVMLHFLCDLLASGEVGEGTLLLSNDIMALSVVDVVEKSIFEIGAQRSSWAPADQVAILRVVAVFAHFLQRQPRLAPKLQPLSVPTQSTTFLIDHVAAAVAEINEIRSSAAVRLVSQAVVSLALVPDDRIAVGVNAAVGQWATPLLTDLCRTFVTICKLPGPDFDSDIVRCASLAAMADALLELAPPVAQHTGLAALLRDLFFDGTVAVLLKSHDDALFTKCAAGVVLLLRCTAGAQFGESLALSVLCSGVDLRTRCLDVSDDVAGGALSLFAALLERAPLSCLAVLGDETLSEDLVRAEGGSAVAPDLFPGSVVQRQSPATGDAETFAVEAQRRVMLAGARFASPLPPALSASIVAASAVPVDAFPASLETRHCSSLLKVVCQRLRAAAEQPVALTAAATSVLCLLAALPGGGRVAALFGDRSLGATALRAVKAAVEQRLAADTDAKREVLRVLRRPLAEALEELPQMDRLVANCVALEAFRQEVAATWQCRNDVASQLQL